MTTGHITVPALAETGYVVLDRYDQARDPEEWHDLEYTGWRAPRPWCAARRSRARVSGAAA